MKNISELLRDGDPLRDEPAWSDRERRAIRQAVLDRPASAEGPSTRPFAVASIVALALIALALIVSEWSRTSAPVLAAVRFEVRLAEETPGLELREAAISGSDRRTYLHRQVVVANGDILQADVIQGGTASTFSVAITFTAEGGARMLQATRNHRGRPMAILIDGAVVMAPVVKSPIDTSAVISGDFTRAEAERIAAGIRIR